MTRFSIPAAWRRVSLAVGGLLFLEVGTRVALPRIDGRVLAEWFNSGHGGWLIGLYDRLAAGGLSHGGWLALGIMPYVSARIFMKFMRMGERVRTTRVLALVLAAVQAAGFARWIQSVPGAVSAPGPDFVRNTVLTLTAGTLITMWMYEKLAGRAVVATSLDSSSTLQLGEGSPEAQPITAPDAVREPYRGVPTPV